MPEHAAATHVRLAKGITSLLLRRWKKRTMCGLEQALLRYVSEKAGICVGQEPSAVN